MSTAKRDDNFVTTLLAVSSVDGVTPVTLYANPTTHRLLVDLSGGSGTPGGLDTQVQFNDGGTFGGDAGLTYNKTTDALTVAGSVAITAATQDTIAAFTTASKTITSLSVATYPTLTELSYVKGVTSSIQTQINAISAGAITWSEVTGTSQAGAINSGYILNNAGLVTLTIPDTAAVGSILRVVGKGSGGWRISQNASEIIHFGDTATTTGVGGYLASFNRYDCVELVCTVANTEWTVMSSQGNITIV